MEALKIEQRIKLNTSSKNVWKILTEAQYTKQYMYNCEVKSSFKEGALVEWRGNYQGYDAYQFGEVLDVIPFEKLVYTTYDPNYGLADLPENYVHVSYELIDLVDETELIVSSWNFNGSEERMSHAEQGWKMILTGIEQVVQQITNK